MRLRLTQSQLTAAVVGIELYPVCLHFRIILYFVTTETAMSLALEIIFEVKEVGMGIADSGLAILQCSQMNSELQ